eukprot:4090344-Prorocentrum_lima.AAC.1
MTSSLVGSEMCIRDRTELIITDEEPSQTTDNYNRKRTSKKRPPPPPAVSYTHLTLPTICSV